MIIYIQVHYIYLIISYRNGNIYYLLVNLSSLRVINYLSYSPMSESREEWRRMFDKNNNLIHQLYILAVTLICYFSLRPCVYCASLVLAINNVSCHLLTAAEWILWSCLALMSDVSVNSSGWAVCCLFEGRYRMLNGSTVSIIAS